MDAVKVFKNYSRMCKSYGDDHLEECPLSRENNKHNIPCNNFVMEYPEEAIVIIEEWSREHPVITNGMKFGEVFGAMKQTTPVHNCGFFKHKNCSNFMEGIIPCNYCPWWDEPYVEPKSEEK